jgi:hypothetical protein
MKTRRPFLSPVMVVAAVALAVLLLFGGSARAQKHAHNSDGDFTEQDAVDQTYTLSPGAQVEVRGINGSVDIETTAGATAEVHILRLARTRDDLNYHKVLIDQSASSLVVHGENNDQNNGNDHQVRQQVTLRIPRQVNLNVNGVNGKTTVGEIDGPVLLHGINGAVSVAQASGYSEISGINGRVKVNIVQLGQRGIHVSGVNGGVEIQFAEDLNADVEVTGINGRVNADVPNVTVMGKLERNSFRARVGSGGTPIVINGVNGVVHLTRGGVAG